MKTDIMSVSCLYNRKKALWVLRVELGKDVLRWLIKFSVSLFLFTHPGWVKQGTTGIFLLRGWEDSLIVLAYCSLSFLFNSLLSSSLSTSSVPSLSFRSLAAWYQVWLILLCRISSDLGSYVIKLPLYVYPRENYYLHCSLVKIGEACFLLFHF